MQTFLGQLWKEYGKGDSRYMTSDTFTVCMETITAFVDGPLAFWATIAFIVNSSNRYVVQLLLSLFQLYGDVLYFYTEVKEDFSHGPKGHPLYFWFYFFTMNIIWIIIPSCLIVEAFVKLSSAQQLKDNTNTKGNGKKRN
jgi:cholestenol delta-isomerase